MPAAALMPGSPLLAEALADRRVTRALRLALRDAGIREAFESLRALGHSVDEAVSELLGPHEDDAGAPYYLSEERVRAIVYRK